MVIAMGIYSKYLVCYDIENNRTRTKFFNFLKDLGLQPLQKSVFYGELNAAELRSLAATARESLEPTTDSCLWIICPLKPMEFDQFVGYKNFPYIEADGHETL